MKSTPRGCPAARGLAGIVAALGMFLATGAGSAAENQAQNPSIALYYGADPPLQALRAFDIVVVDPDHPVDPLAYREGRGGRRPAGRSELFAYVSVGEVHPSRSWFGTVPPTLFKGTNTAWGSRVVDQAAPEWPAFFADRVVAPLWQRGFRGFFIDTLDSYQLIAKTEAERAAQEEGLVRTIKAVRSRFPGARLILNRGFEVLPRLAGDVFAVAAESLFQGWDPVTRRYREVPADDREWLLTRLKEVQTRWQLPVLAIDYCDPKDRALARATAKKIRALGFIPWVSNADLDQVGVGAIEVEPRRVLLLYDKPPDLDPHYTEAQRFVAMPLNYLGYTVELHDIADPLPAAPLTGRYAGIATWFTSGDAAAHSDYAAWLKTQIEAGMRVAVFNHLGIAPEPGFLRTLGLDAVVARRGDRLTVVQRDPIIGFEAMPAPVPALLWPVRLAAPESRSLLTLEDRGGRRYTAAAITPWGGFALAPFAISEQRAIDANRWVVQPLQFLAAALRTPPDRPVPDVTTENGRRLLLVHVDGDGFASRAELPGAPYAGAVLLERVLERYRIPTTVSVIQAEIAANGLYPELAPTLEPIARSIFALPHVEMASHSFSHPFYWQKAMATADTGSELQYTLKVPGYSFRLDAEIAGSVNYLDSALAPPGKRTRVFLWTGDCVPDAQAIRATVDAGVLNMNGGDTRVTDSRPSWTSIAALGIVKRGELQVFAAHQNENIYTNLWSGPFYGFQRAIETFERTGTPIRFKPIDIYYHSYIASKPAALESLDRVYRWALAQPVFPVFASEYIERVVDFDAAVIFRALDEPEGTWHVRTGPGLRTLRLPAETGPPDLGVDSGVIGWSDGPDGRYVHLGTDEAVVRPGRADAARTPFVVEATGRIEEYRQRPDGADFTLIQHRSEVPTTLRLGAARGCQLRVDGVPVSANPAAPIAGIPTVTYVAVAPRTGPATYRQLVSVRCP